MKIEKIKEALKFGSKEFGSETVRFLLDEIDKYKKANVVELKSWKGTSGYEIYNKDFIYRVVEYRKDKNTGEVKENYHDVPKENVDYMKKTLILLGLTEKKLKYRDIVKFIIEDKNLDCTIDAFNGGKWRAKVYFPFYYFPLKILEHQRFIIYGGSGTIKYNAL